MSSPSTISKKRDNYAEQLEQEILDLKIAIDLEPNEHEDLCKECDVGILLLLLLVVVVVVIHF